MKLTFFKFIFFSIRSFRTKINSIVALSTYFGIPLVISFLAAIVMKTSTYDSYTYTSNPQIKNFLFLTIIITIFIGLTNSIREVISHRAHFAKEQRTGLGIGTYLFATFFVLITILFLQVFLIILSSSLILNFPSDFSSFFLFPFLAGIAATATGFFVSSVVTSEVTAITLVPLILIPQMIFSGLLIDFQDMNKNIFFSKSTKESTNPIPEVADLMISRWAVEAYLITIATLKDPRDECILKYKNIEELLKKKLIDKKISRKEFYQQRIKNVDIPTEEKCYALKSTRNEFIDIDNEKKQQYGFMSSYRNLFGTYISSVYYNTVVILAYTLLFILLTFLSLQYNWWNFFKQKN